MLQIGQHLAEQRRRLHLSLDECESATRIRAKHLIALEEDRPEDLPDAAYARLFLRGYATFLGLDADALLMEFDERHGADPLREQHRLVALEPPREGRVSAIGQWLVSPRRRSPRRQVGWLVVGLVGSLAVVVWIGARGGGPPPPPAPDTAAPAPVAAPPVAATRTPAPPPARTAARLVLRGIGTAGSYVRVQRQGAAGPVVYEGTIRPGQAVSLAVRGPLWMRVGWAPSLGVALSGRPVALPGGTGNFLVRRTGVAPAA